MITLTPLLALFTFAAGLSDCQVLQREKNGTASAIVSGKSDGEGRLYCRIDNGRWTEIAAIRPGDWKAKLPAISTGGPYAIDLRADSTSGARLAEKGFREVFVGDLWILAGQSNMVGRAKIDPAHQTDPLVRMLALNGVWQLATHPLHEQVTPPGATRPGTGPGLDFAREMVRKFKVPIGLLPCAKGGTSMEQWSPALAAQGPASLYGNLLGQVRLAGGRVTGVLWYQGENDTGTEPSAVYKTKFQAFVARLRADLNRPDLPFIYAQLARYVNSPEKFYLQWNIVQEAQRVSESEIPNVRMVATVDLEMGDLIHLSRGSQDRLGRRFALAAQGKTGPRLAEARWDSPNELRLRLTGVNGELKTAGGRVFGFEAVTPNDQRKIFFFQVSVDPANGEVVLLANRDGVVRDVPEAIDLWYGRGHDPICNLTDSEDLALPVFGPWRLTPRPPAPPRTPAPSRKR
ncbi:MAG: sialate O-acetylesterase [Verrucomicrobia bacterium]|nr:sialate O-acetylesterase [Verrucomicrobiota bacterium]